MEEGYGFLALLPPLVAIVLCFVTKGVIISLFLGIFTGGIIIANGNPLAGFSYTLDKIIGSMSDEWNARLLLFNLLMGAGIAFIWRLGGSKAMMDWAKTKIKTRTQADVGAWLLGVLVFFNDYVNAAIVGNVFRDIFDEFKLSKEKLSYILDSTASPVATFFISDWIAFQIGMVQSGLDGAGIKDISAFSAYVQGIPFNFYCIFTVLFVGMLAITGKDFGPMLKAEHRTLTTGATYREGAVPMMDVSFELGKVKETKPMLRTFFLPIIALIAITLFGFYWTGREGNGLMDILANADAAKALLWGAFYMTLVGVIIALYYKIMNVTDTMNTVMDGMKLMLLACSILVLAWSLGTVTKDMKLADFMISLLGDSISFAYVPVIIFIAGCIISFATGTSWGTMTILTPIAIPLAYKMTGDVYSAVIMSGVVFSGAIFGDHCSPISDTTVLASIFAGADHLDHVSTQLPYALVCAIVAGILFLVYGIFAISPIVLIPIGIVALFVIMYGANAWFAKKYGISTT